MKTQVEVQKEKQLLNQFNLAEILNDHSIDAIIAMDTGYRVIAWNKAAATLYGVSKNKATGKLIFELIPDIKSDQETVKAIQRASFGDSSFVPASKLFAHRKHRENHFIGLKDSEGRVIGVMNIVHDVAHRIKAEQQLQLLNEELERKMRQLKLTSDELASFTYITSNKIKEPIRQIYTGVEHLIKTEASHLSDSGKAAFRRMQSSINRMDLLLDDVLSLAQISILQKPDTEINLNVLMTEVIDHIKKVSEKNINIVAEELCTIVGHKNYLYLLFYNLLENAVKFNESETPVIKITCEKVGVNELNKLLKDAEYYKISIENNGIGFNASDTERIFSMFEKLNPPGKYKGTGTGLAIARKIMEAHDGFISAEGTSGRGAAFHCFFPAKASSNSIEDEAKKLL